VKSTSCSMVVATKKCEKGPELGARGQERARKVPSSVEKLTVDQN
jgi:hypothetical protein